MNRFIIVDFETTGSHPRHGDSIIQIGAVTIDDGVITDSYSTYVNPGQPIPAFITSLTGITDDMVADAPQLEDVLPDLLRMLDGRTFVAHNAFFDLAFLQEALQSQGYYAFDGYVLDTVELARILLPMQGGYRLMELASDFDIEHENPHQADSDAMATARLFLLLLNTAKSLPLVTIQRLQQLVTSFRSDIQTFFQQLEMEMLIHSFEQEADETLAVLDVYRGLALKKRPEKKAEPPVQPAKREWDEELEEFLAEQGGLARNYEGFQRREAQESMMRVTYQAMEDGRHLLVEAGTGTGKSLGYLLPSVVWATQNRQQVVISTHTIHLQEQLLYKDIPLLMQSLPVPFSAAKLKGRGNYLCLRKFEHSLELPDEHASQDLQLTKAKMITWLTQTESGDVEEINLSPGGGLFWQSVKSDVNSCLHRKCPWFTRCYYFRAKEQAREADLLVVNHALLMRDLQDDSRILPPYEIAVIDEAHQLEEVASQHLGLQYSSAELFHLLDRLQMESEKDVLHQLFTEYVLWKPECKEEIRQTEDKLKGSLAEAREEASQWSQSMFHWGQQQNEEQNEFGRIAVRFDPEMFHARQKKMGKSLGKLLDKMAGYATTLELLLSLSKDTEEGVPYTLQTRLTDARGILDDVQQAMQRLHALLVEEGDGYVRWMEMETRTTKKHLYFFRSPLEVSAPLLDKLFEPKRSIVLTSATLTVKNSFSYFMKRYGLDLLPESRVQTLQLSSPFDYERQGMLLVPTDFPSLGKDRERDYIDAVIQGCADAIEAAGGRTMILFTSYAMLKQVYDGLKEKWSEQEYLLLGHGIDSSNRSKLVRRFQAESRAVLLGTSSFWEGVDIPGDALSCLIIVRLPFAPPNTPLLEGRSEKLKEEKKNPFMSLSLPHAIIRLKQGVGRLIRHHHDKGVVIIFDTRIVESRYGRTILQSIPAFHFEAGPWPKLRETIAPFLAREQE